MTQAARSDLVSCVAPPARPVERIGLTVATGVEQPAMSPALELQMILEEKLSAVPNTHLDYGRVALFGTAMLGAGGICLGFWWTALSWTASILG